MIAGWHETVGRGHAERLVPMIAALPGGGRAGAVLVDAGPGSFTGIRVGLAAARALGLGWSVPVHAFSALPLIAAMTFAERDIPALAVITEGGHGEVFMASFDRSLAPLMPAASLVPAAAMAALGDLPAVGSGLRRLTGLPPERRLGETLPEAAGVRLLPPALRALAPTPIYGRAPDARPMA